MLQVPPPPAPNWATHHPAIQSPLSPKFKPSPSSANSTYLWPLISSFPMALAQMLHKQNKTVIIVSSCCLYSNRENSTLYLSPILPSTLLLQESSQNTQWILSHPHLKSLKWLCSFEDKAWTSLLSAQILSRYSLFLPTSPPHYQCSLHLPNWTAQWPCPRELLETSSIYTWAV